MQVQRSAIEADEQQQVDPDADPAAIRKDALVQMVVRRIAEAKQARATSGIELIWDQDEDQYEGIDELTDDAAGRRVKDDAKRPGRGNAASGRSRLYLNITKPKTDAAVARVQEMLVPSDDRPFRLKPTPIPEFAEAAKNDDQTIYTLADGTQATGKQVAQVEMDRAQKACDAAEQWVEDHFVEGGVYGEIRKVIRDAGRLGTGAIMGPVPVARTLKRWRREPGTNVTVLEQIAKTSPSSRCVSIRDCFPDPACGDDIHQGSFFVFRDFLTARQMRALARATRPDGAPEYERAAIAECLREGPRNRGRDREGKRGRAGEVSYDSEVFEVYYYYGDIDARTVLEMGADPMAMGLTAEPEPAEDGAPGVPQPLTGDALDEKLLDLDAVPAIVVMCNDQPIKCTVNPMETGCFPFDFFPWEEVADQPWGRGVPRKMRPAQTMLVSAVRAMLEDAGLTAGLQLIYAPGYITPAEGQQAKIQGRMVWHFDPFGGDDGDGEAKKIDDVFQAKRFDSAQQQLAAIIEYAMRMADELTNLPMLLQGQQGSAPELLGGMQMLMQNASAPLRVIAKVFDDRLITPHLRRWYDYCQQMGPDEAKGDLEVEARGSTALVAREIAREFLVMRAPALAQMPNSRINPERLEEETLKSFGVPTQSIFYTEDEFKALQKQRAENPPPGPPQIEVARIREQGMNERHKLDMENQAAQRAIDKLIVELEFQIQAMELANKKDVSLADLKAMLAAKAIDSRDKRELFAAERALKLDPDNEDNRGI